MPSVDYLHVYTGMSGAKTVSIYDMTGKEVIAKQSVQADAFVVDVSFFCAFSHVILSVDTCKRKVAGVFSCLFRALQKYFFIFLQIHLYSTA